THGPRPRTVYVEEPVRMTRAACVVRLNKRQVTDPATGKSHTVEEPVCETRQVTETVKRYVLRNEVASVPVTRHHLVAETRPETVKEYVPTWEEAVVNVTRYRMEQRAEVRRDKAYHLDEWEEADEARLRELVLGMEE